MEKKSKFLSLLISFVLVVIVLKYGDSLADDVGKPSAGSVVTSLVGEDSTVEPSVVSAVKEEPTIEPQVVSVGKEKVTVERIDANSSSVGNALLYIVIMILALTTLLSVGISFYLYKWRKILLENNQFVVPEEWAKCLRSLDESVGELNQTIGSGLQVVGAESKSNSEKISAMTETYMELQDVLDQKDKEIKRLKTGYDAVIFKRFVRRFARIEQSIDDFIFEDGETEQLIMLRRLFEDAFDECGVCKFSPEIGEDYRRANGVSDNPKSKKTDNAEDEFKISEVLEAGYKLGAGADEEVIIPAKVRIFKLG